LDGCNIDHEAPALPPAGLACASCAAGAVPRPPLVIFNEEVRGPVDGFEHDSQMTLSWCLFLPRDFFDNSFAVRRSFDVRELLLVTCEMNAHALTDLVRIFDLKRQNFSQEGFYAIVDRNPVLPPAGLAYRRPAARALFIRYDTKAAPAPIMKSASASSALDVASSNSGWRIPFSSLVKP
jgi:hypothetical protein